jgi:DNA-binding YbaB/EbfC family protein
MKSMEEMIKAAQQAAETIQKQMSEAQNTLEQIMVEGVSGGGLVKIRATAKGRVVGVAIDDSLMVGVGPGSDDAKQMLEDLVAAAFNDARVKADAASGAEMERIQGSMGLPPGFKLPGMG